MIKCLYREDHWREQRHCDRKADYIYLGRSYCAEHTEIRSEKQKALYEEQIREIENS